MFFKNKKITSRDPGEATRSNWFRFRLSVSVLSRFKLKLDIAISLYNIASENTNLFTRIKISSAGMPKKSCKGENERGRPYEYIIASR